MRGTRGLSTTSDGSAMGFSRVGVGRYPETRNRFGTGHSRISVMRSLLSAFRMSTLAAAAFTLVECAPSHAGDTVPAGRAASVPDSGAFVIDGDPRQPNGAPWSFRGRVDGVDYELTGVLLVPGGPGPFPAVVLSHGNGGNGRFIANQVGETMVTWGFVGIAPDYTHAVDV